MKTRIQNLFIALVWLALPALVQAQFTFTTNNGAITITGYNTAAGLDMVIPAMTNGYPVTSIGGSAFVSSGITNVTIPNSVTNIGAYALADCASLTSITVDAANPAYSSMNGVLFDKAKATLLQFPGGLGGSYTIPNSVKSIGDGVFEYCFSLTSVTIPNSVTSIGESAFAGCTSLTSVTIPGSVTSMGDYAFYLCTSLTSVTILNGVTSIGEFAFANCTNLTSVTIPNGVTNIGVEVFADCYSLRSVNLPNSVTNIGDYAFYYCLNLTNVTIPNSVKSIGDGVFEYCFSLTSVTIGNSVTSIGALAFHNCFSLRSVTLPNSVTSIGTGAFADCTSLTSVAIPASVTSIEDNAFEYCTSLTSVYFTGNAPSPTNDSTVFTGDLATAYYLPGTTGWGAMFDGRPTAPWFLPNPQILNFEPGFGIQPGGFGFTISWATNASVVVQAATNLANPIWLPVSTSPLTSGTNYFSDPQWTNYPERFYRVTSAFTVGGTLTGLPAGDTVTLQDNGSDNLTLSTNGTFTFPTALPSGQSYSVTISGISGGTETTRTLMNGSGTISGANVTNVAVLCPPLYTGNMDLDMYNAAVADGTDHGGVPAVMYTQDGGPFKVTANGFNSHTVCLIYGGYVGGCKFIVIAAGTGSCSSTTLPSGLAIQFGNSLFYCGPGPYGY